MNLIYRASDTFWDSLKQLPLEIKRAAIIAFGFFREDPHHNSLNTHKLEGMRGTVFGGHITKGYVFTFRYVSDEQGRKVVESLLVGKHDETYDKTKRMGY